MLSYIAAFIKLLYKCTIINYISVESLGINSVLEVGEYGGMTSLYLIYLE